MAIDPPMRWPAGPPRALLIGVVLSMLAHAAVVLSPALQLPAVDPLPIPVAMPARLVPARSAPPPADVVPAVERSAPRRALRDPARVRPRDATPPPARTAASETFPQAPARPPAQTSPAPELDALPASPEPAPVPALGVPTPDLPEPPPAPEPILFLAAGGAEAIARWPSRGEVEYDVLYGEQGVRLGRAVHRWHHDETRYEMESVATAGGLLSAIDALSYIQRSRGRLLPQGLRPEAFEVERGGRRREWSDFDWDKGEVTLYRDNRARYARIERGDQDVLTLWHQLGLAEPWAGPIELTVVTGKSAATTRVEPIGDETLEVPAGRFATRHLRAEATEGRLRLDVWLAVERHWVPVRIRMRDRDGGILDQQARRISIGDAAGTAAQAAPPAAEAQ